MNVYLELVGGGTQEAFGVRAIEYRDGLLWLDDRSMPMARVRSLSTLRGTTEAGNPPTPESGSRVQPGGGTEQ